MSRQTVDWSKIRMEYVLKRTPYRELARKYGVSFKTLGRKAAAEGWVQMSSTHGDVVATEARQKALDAGVEYAKRLYALAGKVMDKAEELLNLSEPLAPRDLKSLSSTLMDLRELVGVEDDGGQADGSDAVEVVFVNRTEEATR